MLYFNFLHAPNGGGYQNSISFLHSLTERNFDFSNTTLLVFKGTDIHSICIERKLNHKAIKMSLLSKLLFEIFAWRFLKKGDSVFALFGPPLPFSKGSTLNIGGMAISNVFHKEIDFWGHLNPASKFIKKLKDRYRVYRYKKLDFWIFETDLLKRKAVTEFNFPESRCFVVKMAPSLLVSNDSIVESSASRQLENMNSCHKFLFLSGAHPNKRLHLLPELAKHLKNLGVDFKFILTAPHNNYLSSVLSEASRLEIQDKFLNVKSVKASEVAGVISKCDYICTFSALESFSNNFVEAWAMKKPLLVTDAEWARASCQKAAVYIDLNDLASAARTIHMAISNNNLMAEKTEEGTALLKKHPSAELKTSQYLDIINKAMQMGNISNYSSKKISL